MVLGVEGDYFVLTRALCENGGFERLKDLSRVAREEMLRELRVRLWPVPCRDVYLMEPRVVPLPQVLETGRGEPPRCHRAPPLAGRSCGGSPCRSSSLPGFDSRPQEPKRVRACASW